MLELLCGYCTPEAPSFTILSAFLIPSVFQGKLFFAVSYAYHSLDIPDQFILKVIRNQLVLTISLRFLTDWCLDYEVHHPSLSEKKNPFSRFGQLGFYSLYLGNNTFSNRSWLSLTYTASVSLFGDFTFCEGHLESLDFLVRTTYIEANMDVRFASEFWNSYGLPSSVLAVEIINICIILVWFLRFCQKVFGVSRNISWNSNSFLSQ